MDAKADAATLAELLQLLDQAGYENPVTPTAAPLILPLWSSGYALATDGRVTGIKLSRPPRAQAVLEKIMQFRSLERLVLHTLEPVSVPASIAGLTKLKFVWLGGAIKQLPPEIVDLNMRIFSEETRHELQRLIGGLSRLFEVSAEFVGGDALESDGGNTEGSGKDPAASALAAFEQRLARQVTSEAIARENRQGSSAEAAEIRKLLRESSRLRGLFLAGVQLEDPPLEIAAKGREAIATYFRNRKAGDLPLNELKILLVGNGSCGKTSLVKRVFGDDFDANEPQTHGINIRTWAGSEDAAGSITAHFWDFGGQEIMHATHQFFLSKRSFYILVLDGRKEEDAEYWLQHIESFGGDSPILVVLNKIDEHASFELNRRFLSQKYQGIVGFARLSCATGAGISDFAAQLRDELRKVSVLNTRWPDSWFRVKERLQTLESAYISLSEYERLCTEEGVTDHGSRETLVDFLHDLGVVLHFRDLQLLDTHVLDPKWVTEGVYRIINSETLAEQKGILHVRQLRDILGRSPDSERRYPPDKHQYLIELMLKFELCYKLDAGTILVPDLLDVQEPWFEFDRDDALRFVVEYSYLPRSVLPRFIVRLHRDISGNVRWRTGVKLEDRQLGAAALVRADEKANRIYIFVNGQQRRDYFAVIRKVIADINASFEKLTVTEFVPLPDTPDVLIDYRELVGHERARREDIFVGRLGRSYNVQILLSGIETRSTRQRPDQTIINIHGDYVAGSVTTTSTASTAITLPPKEERMSYEAQGWEKVVVYAAGVLFVLVVAFLAIRNQPIADPNLVVFIRIVLSLVVAAFGATVPGMLHVDFSRKGIVIRAGGALALFVLTFMLTPSVISVAH